MLASDLLVRHSFSLDIFHLITFSQHHSESQPMYPSANIVLRDIFVLLDKALDLVLIFIFQHQAW